MPRLDSYDEVAYGDLTFHDTHPSHLAAVASLVGLDAPPPASARVLEIGCGTGFNLIAMALAAPDARFTGIDLSANQIARAKAVAASAGARNVNFEALSITDYSAPPDSFDYILAHGVYSWVPPAVRESILAVIRDTLAPAGLAYLSYNTNPGWRLRGLLRDGFAFFTPDGAPPARDRMQTLLDAMPNPTSIFAQAFRAEWEGVRHQPDYYLLHEHCAGENNPFYFAEFSRDAAAFGLEVAADARFVSNAFAQNEETSRALDSLAGPDPARRESTLDWLVGRYFRQSILCRAGRAPAADANPLRTLDLHLALTVDILERAPGRLLLRNAWDKEVALTDAACLEVILQFDQFHDAILPARAVETSILSALGLPPVEGLADPLVASVLWTGWRSGFWTFRVDTPALATTLSDRPAACPLARLQARAGVEVTNRLHRPVKLSPDERAALLQADGATALDRDPILESLLGKALLTG